MYTIDASVWINGFDQREAGHSISRQVLTLIATHAVPIVIPYLVLAEVAGAISRRIDPLQGQTFAASLGTLPNITFVALDALLAQESLLVAAQHGLRGADAVYAAVAIQAGCTLISLDNEHHTRLQGIVLTRTPAEVLPDLTPPSS